MLRRRTHTPRWLLIAGGVLGLVVVAKALGLCHRGRGPGGLRRSHGRHSHEHAEVQEA